MPEKGAKQKAKRGGVLGTLPASRPERIGAPRNTARATTTGTRRATAKASAKTTTTRSTHTTATASASAKPAPKPAATTRRKVRATKPAATPRRNGTTAARGAPKPPAPHGPTAVRPASPPLETHRATDAPPPRPIGAPRGTELVTTTIRAAGELTQIGFTVTGQLLKRAVDRIPRP